MEARRKRRLAISALLAFVFIVSTAAAALAWNSTCSTGEVCVWRHADFGEPRAAKGTSDSTYTNDQFPNTQTTINDQVSSVRNRFNVKDVVFHFDADYEGTSFCLRAGFESSYLAGHNDEYSSHIVAAGSTC